MTDDELTLAVAKRLQPNIFYPPPPWRNMKPNLQGWLLDQARDVIAIVRAADAGRLDTATPPAR